MKRNDLRTLYFLGTEPLSITLKAQSANHFSSFVKGWNKWHKKKGWNKWHKKKDTTIKKQYTELEKKCRKIWEPTG